jgi:hypothetical protein
MENDSPFTAAPARRKDRPMALDPLSLKSAEASQPAAADLARARDWVGLLYVLLVIAAILLAVSHGKGPSHHAVLSGWGPHAGTEKVDVSLADYQKIEPGTEARVLLFPGALGFSWHTVRFR